MIGRGAPPLARLLTGVAEVMGAPSVSHPFVLTETVVYRELRYQKSKPIGRVLKYPSSSVPEVSAGDVAPDKFVNVPLEAEKV
jgi:hypothetical protein